LYSFFSVKFFFIPPLFFIHFPRPPPCFHFHFGRNPLSYLGSRSFSFLHALFVLPLSRDNSASFSPFFSGFTLIRSCVQLPSFLTPLAPFPSALHPQLPIPSCPLRVCCSLAVWILFFSLYSLSVILVFFLFDLPCGPHGSTLSLLSCLTDSAFLPFFSVVVPAPFL